MPEPYLYNRSVPPTGSAGRRAYLDWARGIAVLLMIEAHTLDAWVRVRDRASVAYGYGTVLGGFAAPLFLWLAGLGVAMSMARAVERGASRRQALEAAVARGCEIFILAFLFRLQAFIVSPGSHPVTIFRVDVLNVMAPAMAVTAILWAVASTTFTRVALCAGAAAGVSLITPLVRAAAFVNALPLWLEWYVRPAGEFTTFTLLPWAGFVFAGAAVGALIAAPRNGAMMHRAVVIVGVMLVAIGLLAASQPSIYRVPVYFWTSSPTWFAVRVGILMAVAGALWWVPPVKILEPLALLGRSSLFIYWIHVELVYGYASWLWRHRMPMWVWAFAYTAFLVLMYRAIGWRDLAVQAFRDRAPARTPVGMSP